MFVEPRPGTDTRSSGAKPTCRSGRRRRLTIGPGLPEPHVYVRTIIAQRGDTVRRTEHSPMTWVGDPPINRPNPRRACPLEFVHKRCIICRKFEERELICSALVVGQRHGKRSPNSIFPALAVLSDSPVPARPCGVCLPRPVRIYFPWTTSFPRLAKHEDTSSFEVRSQSHRGSPNR